MQYLVWLAALLAATSSAAAQVKREKQIDFEDALVEGRRRDGEVLHHAGEVAEPDVDVLDLLVLDQLDDVVG